MALFHFSDQNPVNSSLWSERTRTFNAIHISIQKLFLFEFFLTQNPIKNLKDEEKIEIVVKNLQKFSPGREFESLTYGFEIQVARYC